MYPNYLIYTPRMPIMISEDCNAPELRSRRQYETGYRVRLGRRAVNAAAALKTAAAMHGAASLSVAATLSGLALVIALAV